MVLKPNPMPTTKSLWNAAVIMFIIKVVYLEASPTEALACFVSGPLQAITPITIMFGSIVLLDCMDSSQCLAWIKVQLRNITNCHPVAEVMLVGFCFSFVCDGAGIRPVTLAAPMLFSMGHPKLECVVCILFFNAPMAIMGAAGIPVWFGVGEAVPEYEDSNLLDVAFYSALAMAVSAHLLVPYIVRIIVPWDELRPSLLFILLSTTSITVPFVGLSLLTYEFPTIGAGIVGTSITAVLTVFGVGLGPHKRQVAGDENTFDEALSPATPLPLHSSEGKDGPGATRGYDSESQMVKKVSRVSFKADKDIELIESHEVGKDEDRKASALPVIKSVSFHSDKEVTDDQRQEKSKDEQGKVDMSAYADTHQEHGSDFSRQASDQSSIREKKDAEPKAVMPAIQSVTFDADTFEVTSLTFDADTVQAKDFANIDLDAVTLQGLRKSGSNFKAGAEEDSKPTWSTRASIGKAHFRTSSNLDEVSKRYSSSIWRGRSGASGFDRSRSRGSLSSLKSRAVNAEVQLTKKDIKVLTKRNSMIVPPAEVMRCLNDDDEAPAQLTVDIGDEEAEEFNGVPSILEVIFRTLPLWLTFLLLILTRMEPIGLKTWLREDTPRIVDGNVGTLGHLAISSIGNVRLTKILGTNLSWAYELFYTPAILPFCVAGWCTLLVFRRELSVPPYRIMRGVLHRIRGPAVALSGALVLVELMRNGDDDPAGKDAPAVIIGMRLADALADGWVLLTFPLGALGAFFSGSTVVSMLTFSQVQRVAAETLGLSSEVLIALQLCGATSGNCCCLANIISAQAVIGLHVSEGVIVKRLLLPVFSMFIICTAVLVPFAYA